MKLASYEMREAFDRKDWNAALAILAAHFEIVFPDSVVITRSGIYCDSGHISAISAQVVSPFGDAARYAWSERGFRMNYGAYYSPVVKIWCRP